MSTSNSILQQGFKMIFDDVSYNLIWAECTKNRGFADVFVQHCVKTSSSPPVKCSLPYTEQ